MLLTILFNKNRRRSALLAIGLAASAFPSHAATSTVINTNDSGAGSLRQALSDAESGAGADIVNITATGTITLTSGQINVSDNAGVTITGPGATNLTITTALNSRVFNFANAGTVRISGISFSSAGGQLPAQAALWRLIAPMPPFRSQCLRPTVLALAPVAAVQCSLAAAQTRATRCR